MNAILAKIKLGIFKAIVIPIYLLNGIFELMYIIAEILHGIIYGLSILIARLFSKEGAKMGLEIGCERLANSYMERCNFQIKIIKKIAGI